MTKVERTKGAPLNSFEEFRVAFEAALDASARRRRISGVLPVLRRRLGFVLSTEQTGEVLAAIHRAPGADALEFAITLESRLKSNVNNAITRLGPEVLAGYIRETNFSSFYADQETKSPRAMSDWIQQFVHGPADIEEKAALSERRLRSGFGCLLLLIDRPEFTDLVLRLLKSYAEVGSHSGGKKGGPKPSFLFAKTVGAFLISEKPKTSQIKLLLDVTNWLQLEMNRLASLLREHAEQVESLEEKLAASGDQLAKAKDALTQMEISTTDLTSQVSRLTSRLQEQEARAIGIEEHWKEVMRQESAGFSHRVRKQLEHEVNEIRLCLERGNPNVAMALTRVNRILSIVPPTEGKP